MRLTVVLTTPERVTRDRLLWVGSDSVRPGAVPGQPRRFPESSQSAWHLSRQLGNYWHENDQSYSSLASRKTEVVIGIDVGSPARGLHAVALKAGRERPGAAIACHLQFFR